MNRTSLRALLDMHEATSTGSALRANFGDGYLIEQNPVYRATRRAVLASGYRFAPAGIREQKRLELDSLRLMYSRKIIYVRDTISALRQVERQFPLRFAFLEVPTGDNWKNALLHEGSHCAAYARVGERLGKRWERTSTQRELVLLTLLIEAFANTSEIMATAFCRSADHEILLDRNIYHVVKDERPFAAAAVREVGLTVAFKVLLVAFLYSNFLYRVFTDEDHRRMLAAARASRLSASARAALRSLAERALNLSVAFRLKTSGYYFKCMGLRRPITQLTNFDFMTLLEQDFPTLLDELTAIAATR